MVDEVSASIFHEIVHQLTELSDPALDRVYDQLMEIRRKRNVDTPHRHFATNDDLPNVLKMITGYSKDKKWDVVRDLCWLGARDASLSPIYRQKILNFAGIAAFYLGDYPAAKKFFEEVLSECESVSLKSKTLSNLAGIYVRLRDFKSAELTALESRDLDEKYDGAVFNLLVISVMRGDSETEIQNRLNVLYSLRPDIADPASEIGRALRRDPDLLPIQKDLGRMIKKARKQLGPAQNRQTVRKVMSKIASLVLLVTALTAVGFIRQCGYETNGDTKGDIRIEELQASTEAGLLCVIMDSEAARPSPKMVSYSIIMDSEAAISPNEFA